MSTISSDTLFHFTGSAEDLINIFRNEFYPRYSLETVRELANGKKVDIAVPMVCFCDIPLSKIKNHLSTYGYYGIGMSKEWAKKVKLNPVLYLRSGSDLEKYLKILLIDLVKKDKMEKEIGAALKAATNLLGYIKLYEGDFLRNDTVIKNVKFYNEREWRYVPEMPGEELPFLLREEFENPVTRAQENVKLQSTKLSFEPKDIKYVIVKEEKEILAMMRALQQIKSKKYDKDTVELLTSRIITSEQITKDF
ncbi:MAG: hypothetical protein HYS21_00020 [Deltaproteobacteria bacterium]|nr:hypothetical protein [Deltaproteobacteria bacterium]